MNIEKMWNSSSVEGRNSLLKRFGLHYKYNACESPFESLGFGMQCDILHTASILLSK